MQCGLIPTGGKKFYLEMLLRLISHQVDIFSIGGLSKMKSSKASFLLELDSSEHSLFEEFRFKNLGFY